MKNIILLALLMSALTGCATEQPLIKTVYVESKVPVNSIPKPPDVKPPVYEMSKLTENDRKDIGIVGKALVVENKQKDGYISILELIINKYRELSKESEVKSTLEVPGLEEANKKIYEPEEDR